MPSLALKIVISEKSRPDKNGSKRVRPNVRHRVRFHQPIVASEKSISHNYYDKLWLKHL